ncbi:MAG: mechanosensitive ion channel family protein [Methylomonas sp.]|jgi:small conductance mechanosensitive channel
MKPEEFVQDLSKEGIALIPQITSIGFKLLGAILLFVIGRWLIKLALKMMDAAFARQHFDKTLISYINSSVSVGLNVILLVVLLGYFGVETTSFAALIAAIGIAIGAAWAGLLSNFAAGLFLIVLRPFKVGDFISAGGIIGTVKEIGLFASAINTPDNILTLIGNNKILSDNIQNFTANSYRRVERTAQLAHGVDPKDAIIRLKNSLGNIPNVLASPAPEVEILEFNLHGTVLAVRPFCHNNDYWQVYFDTNQLIAAEFSSAGYPAPEEHVAMRQLSH